MSLYDVDAKSAEKKINIRRSFVRRVLVLFVVFILFSFQNSILFVPAAPKDLS